MEFGNFRYHNLKIDISFWDDLKAGLKTAEVRLNDRGYQVGDRLFFSPVENGEYFEEHEHGIVERIITNIVEGGQFGIEQGYCLLSMAKGKSAEKSDKEFPKPRYSDSASGHHMSV